jgi:hypothetical protein
MDVLYDIVAFRALLGIPAPTVQERRRYINNGRSASAHLNSLKRRWFALPYEVRA